MPVYPNDGKLVELSTLNTGFLITGTGQAQENIVFEVRRYRFFFSFLRSFAALAAE